MPHPTSLPAWAALRQLAAARPQRAPAAGAHGLVEGAGLVVDFSRQFTGPDVLEQLAALAEQQGVALRAKALQDGARLNLTEDRAVLHTALRATGPQIVEGEDIGAQVAGQLDAMQGFTDLLRNHRVRGIAGQSITDVVSIGIGGSSLGPQLVVAALPGSGPKVHFVSNIDGAHLESVVAGLDAARTLFIVISKTFTTEETLANARAARRWLAAQLGEGDLAGHFVAVTAAPAAVARSGLAFSRVFEFWDWVGGRFSLWSAAGLPIALHAGFDAFRELLNGAATMDAHALRAPFVENLPMRLALTGVWNQSFLMLPGHAVLPYAHRLGLMPKALQQLEMESNGKSTDLDGLPVDYPTCPILFGEPGTDGQHSFHQWLHQGATRASCDVILVANPMSRETHLESHHDALLANGIAQADALWHGEAHADRHRHYEGGRPVTVIVLPELDAFHLGALLALYEQKVAMQGFVWHINSFDQMGVELGKRLARERLATLGSGATPLQERLAALRRRPPQPRARR